MPELPELTIYAKSLNDKLKGQFISGVQLTGNPLEYEGIPASEQQIVLEISRVGKLLQITTSRAQFGIHLMRTGELYLGSEGEPKSIVGHLVFSDGERLLVSDRMRQAKLTLGPVKLSSTDALDLSIATLSEALKTSGKQTLKAFLIDQTRIAGIGNAYADEILWEAGISPKSLSSALPDTAIVNLHAAIRLVLENAIEVIESHLECKWRGEYRDFLKVHRKGVSLDVNGSQIIHESVGGKSTYYVSAQIEYR